MADPYLGEIRLLSISRIPKGWLPCDGRQMSIAQYSALFSLLGTQFGGDGKLTFALPDLRGRVIVGSNGGSQLSVGTTGGQEVVALSPSEMPAHVHSINATTVVGTSAVVDNAILGTVDATGATPALPVYGPNPNVPIAPAMIGQTGGSQAHSNMQPTLVMSYVIATTGIYPSRPQ